MIYNESKFNTEWDTLPLSKLGEFKRGKSKHRPRNDQKLFEGGTYPLIQTGEIKASNLLIKSHNAAYNEEGLKQSKMWPTGTLAITIAANIAETGILAYPMCFPDSCVGFNADKEKTTELFMHYVFTYIKRRIQSSAVGSIQDNINIEMLTALNFKIPKKPIQNLIVELLSAIDYKIELNNDINIELENLAKTIYNYWFVQFDFPNAEGKPYKSSGGEMEWDEELKREIPKGWDATKIESILAKEPRIKKIQSSEILIAGEIPVIDQSSDFIAGYTNEKDSLIIADTPRIIFGDHTRILKFVNFDFARGADGTQILISTSSRMPQHLFFHTLLKIDLSNWGYARHYKFLKDNYIILPTYDLANKFESLVCSNYLMIRQIIQENQELIKLRDFLLPMLMNGQVKVKSKVKEQLSMAAELQVKYGK